MNKGPEAGANRGYSLKDAAGGRGAQETLRPVNHIEVFLAGHPRGTPRYKVAGDQVALFDAKVRSNDGESWYDETRAGGRTDIRIINQLIRRAKNEADGAEYETEEDVFETEVMTKYLDDARQLAEDEKEMADKMRRDWAIARGKVNARQR